MVKTNSETSKAKRAIAFTYPVSSKEATQKTATTMFCGLATYRKQENK